MTTYLLPIISLFFGAILGLVSTLVAANMRHKQDITIKLLEQYLKVREEIVSSICALADRTLLDSFEPAQMKTHRDTVAVMYYKYYDLLPLPVLESLLLLNVCLTRLDGLTYKIANGKIVRMTEEDTIGFISKCHDYVNGQYLAATILNSNNIEMKINQSIILHTRYVIRSLSTFLPTRRFLTMISSLQNDTGITRERIRLVMLGRHSKNFTNPQVRSSSLK